jgi:D-sedoheptulose 7-phosphate isomerase
MKHSDYLSQYAAAVHAAMAAAEVTRTQDRPTPAAEGLDLAVDMARQVQAEGGTVFFCGNGASSAMAGHMALDWLKAGRLKAISFNDPVVLTAVANDLGYENTFSLPISRLGTKRDLLVTISSSGNSPNVIAALEEARRIGLPSVTFSGFKPDNRSRRLGDLNFFVPCRTYGVAECCHQILLHAWLDSYLGLKEWQMPSA